MVLIQQLRKAYSEGKNFAYFVSFDDRTGMSGHETLYVGGYVSEYDGSSHFICSSDIGSEGIPAIISFDHVASIFPDIKFRRSAWPEIMILHPDSVLHGSYNRIPGTARSFGSKPAVELNGMREKIAYVREKIISGDLLQAVLSEEVSARGISPVNTLERVLAEDTSLYVYYFRFGRYELIGSSPERLITVTGRNAVVNPIAGTRRRDPDPLIDSSFGNDLMNDSKEQCEHRMLVDLARNDLTRIARPETVSVLENMSVRKYSSVQHLVSTVTGTLAEGTCADSVIKAVFPAGTVSGAPKKRALQLIGKLEERPRGAYSGAAGIIRKDGMDLALVIRSIYGIDGDLKVRAGAGIVKDSIPEREAEEILIKMAAVMQR